MSPGRERERDRERKREREREREAERWGGAVRFSKAEVLCYRGTLSRFLDDDYSQREAETLSC